MRRVHAVGGTLRSHDSDRLVKELEDESLRLKEEVRSLKEGKNELEEDNRTMRRELGKVVGLVKGEKTALENIPAAFLTKDKGVDAYIKELQGKVNALKKQNRRLEDTTTKLKEKARTSTRGALPRYLGKPGSLRKQSPAPSESKSLRDIGVGGGPPQESIGTAKTPLEEVLKVDKDTHMSPKVASPLHPSIVPTEASLPKAVPKRVTLAPPPVNAQPISITNLKHPPSETPGPPLHTHYTPYTNPEDTVRLKSSLESVLVHSESALEEKSHVIFQLENIVTALKDKLVASEGVITEMRDEIIGSRVERDEAVKARDRAYSERDCIVGERDYAVKARVRAENDVKSQGDEIEVLHRDRVRLREEIEQVADRARKDRGRWDDNEGSRMEALEALQLSLKEKSAALVILDTKTRDLEHKCTQLHSTNLDMLQEMETLTNHLSRERVKTRDQELDIERLKLQNEASGASAEQFKRLREEYISLQKEHTTAMDRLLETRNLTEMDVRREMQGEIQTLKNTIVKWEAASKTQFKQYQNLCLKLDDAAQGRDAAVMKLAEVEAGRKETKGENELLNAKLSLLVKEAGGQGVLDGLRVDEVVAAMEIVKRADGMKSMKDMVKDFTKEEREDAILELRTANEDLRRQLAVLSKNQQQLKKRTHDAESDANRQVSLAAIKVKQFEDQHKATAMQAQDVIDIQADQIANLTRAIRHGSSAASLATSFSLETDVGDDNILQVSFGTFQPFPNTDLGFANGVVGCLDFYSHETCCTREHFEGAPNFDSHFIYRLEMTDDVKVYMSSINSTVQLLSHGKVVAVGLLSCAQLLGTNSRTTAQGKISICPEGAVGKTCGFLNVKLRLKRPLPWMMPELVNQALDGLQVRQVLPLTVQLEGAERLQGVAGLVIEVHDVDLEAPTKSSVFTTVCGSDLWFTQMEGEATQHPTYGIARVVAVTPTADVLGTLHDNSLPFVLFDDTQREVTDCVGTAQVRAKGLLSGDDAVVDARVTFLTSDKKTAGSAGVKLSWMKATQQ